MRRHKKVDACDLAQIDSLLEGLETAEVAVDHQRLAKPPQFVAAVTPVDRAELAQRRRLQGSHPTGAYQGRAEFPDLFASERIPIPRNGTAEQKVEALRAKLKDAETRIQRFRRAWEVRNAELDHLEQALNKERARWGVPDPLAAQANPLACGSQGAARSYGPMPTPPNETGHNEVPDGLRSLMKNLQTQFATPNGPPSRTGK